MNTLSANLNHAISFFKESSPKISFKQQQTVLIASLVLGLFTACCYALSRCNFKAKILSDHTDSKLGKIAQVVHKSPINSAVLSGKLESNMDHLDDKGLHPIVSTAELSFKTPTRGRISLQLSSSEMPKSKTPKKMKIFGSELKPGMIKTLPRDLTELSLASCSNLTDEDMLDLPPNLEKLSIVGSKKLTDLAIKNLPRTLLELTLSGSTLITDNAIPHLPPHLIKLSIRAGELTNGGMQLLSETLKNLTDLALTGLLSLSDQMISFLSPTIKKLSLTRCDITDEAFKNLSRDLEEFTLVDCMRVKGDGFKDLPPHLKKLSLIGYDVPDDVRALFKETHVQITPPTPSRR